jgi:hypothetical protein
MVLGVHKLRGWQVLLLLFLRCLEAKEEISQNEIMKIELE